MNANYLQQIIKFLCFLFLTAGATVASDKLVHHLPSSEVILFKTTKAGFAGKVVKLKKGTLHVSVIHKAKSEGKQVVKVSKASFVGTSSFEVSIVPEGVDLHVFSGEVVVSSPLIMTFVPEVVKAKEGLRFSAKKKQYIRIKFSPKHPLKVSKN